MLVHKLSNYALVNLQRMLRLKRVVGSPYHVVFDPTNVCQLKCPFCGTGERRPAMLKFDDFKKVIDEIGKTCINLELYNWGEPFLNKDVIEMISYASRKYGTYVRISSNLNVRNDHLNRDLVLSGLSTLTISLDGASQETYEKYRVAGSFDAVIDNIRQIVALKKEHGKREPNLVWQFLVFRHNEHEIDAARKMARELGVDELVFMKPTIPADYRDWDSTQEDFSSFDASSQIAEAGDPLRTPRPPPPAESPAPAALEAEWERKAIASARPSGNGTRCNWPYTSVAINANGSVSPCCGLRREEQDFGNAFKSGFASIWRNNHYRLAREYVSRNLTSPDSENTCGSCEFKGQINFSPNLFQVIYYTVKPLRSLWRRRHKFRVKVR